MMKTLTSECPCRKEYGTSPFLKKGILKTAEEYSGHSTYGRRGEKTARFGKPAPSGRQPLIK